MRVGVRLFGWVFFLLISFVILYKILSFLESFFYLLNDDEMGIYMVVFKIIGDNGYKVFSIGRGT